MKKQNFILILFIFCISLTQYDFTSPMIEGMGYLPNQDINQDEEESSAILKNTENYNTDMRKTNYPSAPPYNFLFGVQATTQYWDFNNSNHNYYELSPIAQTNAISLKNKIAYIIKEGILDRDPGDLYRNTILHTWSMNGNFEYLALISKGVKSALKKRNIAGKTPKDIVAEKLLELVESNEDNQEYEKYKKTFEEIKRLEKAK